MSEHDSIPPVACTLTEEQDEQRPEAVREIMIETYSHSQGRRNGYRLVFEGTDEALPAVAEFVSNELVCCSFAEYTIEVVPPYKETHLTIGGPEGTKDVFGDGLVAELEEAGE